MSESSLTLTPAAAAAVRRGHPWVYRDGLVRPPRALASGEVVTLRDERGRFAARGLWEAASPIAVRVLEHGADRPLDDAALLERILTAFRRRDELFRDSDTTAYRLCNGEGDRVPGLVVDRYGEAAIAKIDGAAMRPWVERLAARIGRELRVRGVRGFALREASARGEAPRFVPLDGDAIPERTIVRERGMAMEVDVLRGQKTGAFLDQRDNRARVRELGRGRDRALNLFSYAGGFSLAAALGGARRVVSVDSASAAHATAQRSFRANGLDPEAHSFVTADVFAYLEQARARGDRYDLVVSDPPSFAPSERARPGALRAYRKLHSAISGVLANGAVLCAASCSSHVSLDEFLGTLDDAALGSRFVVREVHGQPPDHPTTASWPEGRYLKFVVLAG